MTRKDFELIAAVLREQAENWPNEPGVRAPVQSEYASLRVAFADVLRNTNPRFDVSRFLTAAQPRPTAYADRISTLKG